MQAILFDLDGTLVDSSADICRAFSVALTTHGHPAPDPAAVRALIGAPLSEMFPRFAPEAPVEPLIASYRSWYLDHCADETRVLPGVSELLDWLAGRPVRLGVATTKPTHVARRVLEAVGLAGHFHHVQGTDGFPCKPAPDVIHHALRELGVDAPEGWMVGDTPADAVAGRRAGLRAAGVTSGPHAAAALAAAGADPVVDRLDHLRAALA